MSENQKEVNEQIWNDGHASLHIWQPVNGAYPGCFMLVMADGGGYTSLLIPYEKWDDINKKIVEMIPRCKVIEEEFNE